MSFIKKCDIDENLIAVSPNVSIRYLVNNSEIPRKYCYPQGKKYEVSKPCSMSRRSNIMDIYIDNRRYLFYEKKKDDI